MLNPAYLGVILTVPMVLDELGDSFDVLGTSPRFGADWRWFKGLCGEERDFNRHLLAEYHAALHNFLDHRSILPARDPARNVGLESAALAVAQSRAALGGGRGRRRRGGGGRAASDRAASATCRRATPRRWTSSSTPSPSRDCTPEDVAGLPHFGPLFGRETIYLSFEKRG